MIDRVCRFCNDVFGIVTDGSIKFASVECPYCGNHMFLVDNELQTFAEYFNTPIKRVKPAPILGPMIGEIDEYVDGDER